MSAKLRDQRVKFAEMPNPDQPKTFHNWKPVSAMVESKDAARDFAGWGLSSPILVLQGPNGSGKGHLMEAAGREMMERGMWVKWAFVPDWLDRLKATFDRNDEEVFEKLFTSYSEKPDVLLLDDLGAERVTDWTRAQVTRLFDYRYRHDLLTIVTTNDDEATTERKQGSRIADRLFDMGSGKVHVVSNQAESYRTGHRRKQEMPNKEPSNDPRRTPRFNYTNTGTHY